MEPVLERGSRKRAAGRRRGIETLALVLLLVLSLTAAACSSSSDGDSGAQEGSENGEGNGEEEEDVPQPDPVAITVAASLVGEQVQLTGTATVPDGAKVSYELRHPSLTDPAVCQAPGVSCLAVGAVPVTTGQWSATVDVAAWPSGEVPVWSGFQMSLGMEEGQPEEIVELYGENGERIIGEAVITVGDQTHAEARTSILIP